MLNFASYYFTNPIQKGISYTRLHLSYILVYNEAMNPESDKDGASEYQVSPSRVGIAKHFMEKKAKGKFVRFNLKRFEQLYFKSVYTVTESEFENKFVCTWAG
jgi:hypothetical protein